MSNNDDLLLPQNQSGVLNLGQEQYKDEVLERSLELSTDVITSDITFGITDSLTNLIQIGWKFSVEVLVKLTLQVIVEAKLIRLGSLMVQIFILTR